MFGMKETLIGHQTLHRVRERLVDADNQIFLKLAKLDLSPVFATFLKIILCTKLPFSHGLSHMKEHYLP